MFQGVTVQCGFASARLATPSHPCSQPNQSGHLNERNVKRPLCCAQTEAVHGQSPHILLSAAPWWRCVAPATEHSLHPRCHRPTRSCLARPWWHMRTLPIYPRFCLWVKGTKQNKPCSLRARATLRTCASYSTENEICGKHGVVRCVKSVNTRILDEYTPASCVTGLTGRRAFSWSPLPGVAARLPFAGERRNAHRDRES